MFKKLNNKGIAGIFVFSLILTIGSGSYLIYNDFKNGDGFAPVAQSGADISSKLAEESGPRP